jgi:outer membrane murein-binding lipoprotein Lpp
MSFSFLLMILITAVIGSSALVAIGMSMFQRIRRLEAGLSEVDRLAEDVDALREHVLAARDEMGELGQRMDFTERLLSSGRPDEPRKP